MKKSLTKIIKILSTFFGKVFKSAKVHSMIAIKVVDALKYVVDGQAADIFVALTKFTDIDDAGLELIRKVLPSLSERLKSIYGILSQDLDDKDVFVKLTEYIKTLTPNARVDFWVRISAELVVILEDGKITFGEAVWITQLIREELKSKSS